MKKNSIFLLAFIIFVFVCLVVKCFWDYPMWPTIVAAITVASWLFAFSDLFFSSHKSMCKTIVLYEDYPEASYAVLARIKRAVEVRLTQIRGQENSHSLHTKHDELDYYSSVHKAVIEMEALFQKDQETVEKLKGKTKRYTVYANIFSFLGFLILLCIITFEPVAQYFVQSQDYMTVGAFAVILATQYSEGFSENAQQRLQESFKKNFLALDALRKTFESEVTHNSIPPSTSGGHFIG